MMHRIHIGNGSSVLIEGEDVKEAIKRFRAMCPDVTFMTNEGMARAQAALKARQEAAEAAAEPVLMAAE